MGIYNGICNQLDMMCGFVWHEAKRKTNSRKFDAKSANVWASYLSPECVLRHIIQICLAMLNFYSSWQFSLHVWACQYFYIHIYTYIVSCVCTWYCPPKYTIKAQACFLPHRQKDWFFHLGVLLNLRICLPAFYCVF